MKEKMYAVSYAGGERITTVASTCISKACKTFMYDYNVDGKITLDSREQARIRYLNNDSIMSDFVLIEI